jgi:hypothetical protein
VSAGRTEPVPATPFGLRDGHGFTCITAGKPRLIQRRFELIGPTEYGAWLETDTAYSWHGAKLIRLAKRTFKRHGYPMRSEIEVGSGCGPVS